MTVRVRFAPSPTGQVHIGNIRTAIFDWLFARHEGGKFLLRIEDTDRERSTPQAIATLIEVMQWLGLDYDEPPLYQTSQCANHIAAAERLVAEGKAYRYAKGGDSGQATVFRIPWEAESVPGVSRVGPMEMAVNPGVPVVVAANGLTYAAASQKGTPVPRTSCLAGFLNLAVLDSAGTCLFRLDDEIEGVLKGGKSFSIEHAALLRFTRRQVTYRDMVKGDLAKPLDSMADQVIVRSDGNPVFHLANVCDDITQRITHIVRGDDHVENTYRHLFLFSALGANPPRYAHLPMIVNAQGKPYSKRDGDAFVGDYRAKGYQADALFNYLTLLGWSPGDDREKMTRDELVQAFTLERVQSAAAQMDLRKLENLNGQYLAELAPASFCAASRAAVSTLPWAPEIRDEAYFAKVAALMQSRTKLFTHAAQWDYFFRDLPEYDAKACAKFLGKPEVRAALAHLLAGFGQVSMDVAGVERAVTEAAQAVGMEPGKLNQPLRVAVTGGTVGAGIYETIALLGRERTEHRLRHVQATGCGTA